VLRDSLIFAWLCQYYKYAYSVTAIKGSRVGDSIMKSFPLSAKAFILAIMAAGVVVVPFAVTQHDFSHPRELVLFVVIGILAGSKKISLVPGRDRQSADQNKMGSMSVAFAVTYGAILLFGPAGGVLVGVASGLSACLYPKRMPLYQGAFNTSNIAVTAYLSAMIYKFTGGVVGGHIELSHSILPIVASTLAYYILNTLAVATAIGFSSGNSVIGIWRDNFLWTAPGFLAGSSCAVLLSAFIYDRLGIVLLLLPIPVLIYLSYKTFMEKREQDLRHIEELRIGQEQLAKLYLATIESLATAIDAKDTYTREHISRVQSIAIKIACALGLNEHDLEGIKTAALLHDIGKLGVPEHILLKPGKLSADEYLKIQKHPAIGAKILGPVEFPWPVAAMVRCHHEKWDGSGYPDGLAGRDIPLGARILAIADVYDALTSRRSYREGWTHSQAVDHITKLASTHFDPEVIDAFVKVADQIEPLAESSGYESSSSTGDAANLPHEHQKARGAAEDIARANHELMALFELTQTLSTTLNLREVMELVTNKIKNVVQASSCVIFLKDADNPEILKAAVAVGTNGDYLEGASTRLGEGITGRVATEGKAWTGKYDRDDITLSATYTDWAEFNSAMIVPLRTEEGILGTINIYHTQESVFSQDDLQVLDVISKQAGTAIQNAVLFENTRESSMRDLLTGLHNSRFLFKCLEQELNRAQRNSSSLSVLGMDLDNFKLINDNFGHQQGDNILKDVADIFRQHVRDYDLVVRYSGDEFIIVLPETDMEEAMNTASRISQAVAVYAKRLPTSGLAPLGVSVGMASFPEDAGDVKTLLAVADARMYEDKRSRKKGTLAA
jgi:diguanylate cyclase (GGDEF)-like protein/putative nucleotidyltransferase with HDIG domain